MAVDTTNPANGYTDLFSATFDGALSPCTGSDPSWCTFFNGKPGPNRNIIITPTPTGVINAVPLGITPVPAAGSYLDLTLDGARTQVTISGGTIAVPAISLTIQGGTPNATVVNAGGAGVVFSAAPQTAPLDANGRAEFLVNLAPAIAVDFSTFTVIVGAPNGTCSGPLCSIIPILTLDMVRYRLVIDYNADFSTFTADYIGQTGNNSILSITMNSVVPEIAVTDSVAPADDLLVPFGDVTELTSATQTVTVTNAGTANLVLGPVAGTLTLEAPFALANDNCSGATVAARRNCTFQVTFSPGVVGAFSDTLDIPSNDASEPSVTVTVTGNGVALPVPNISITDSVPPADDQLVPFGSAAVGTTADEVVTVTNDGNGDLILGTLASADGLLAPFSLVNDTCSGQTVLPAASCTLTVRFEPTAAVTVERYLRHPVQRRGGSDDHRRGQRHRDLAGQSGNRRHGRHPAVRRPAGALRQRHRGHDPGPDHHGDQRRRPGPGHRHPWQHRCPRGAVQRPDGQLLGADPGSRRELHGGGPLRAGRHRRRQRQPQYPVQRPG